MLRQIKWGVSNGAIAGNGVLPVTASFFRKYCFTLRNSYKELIWCTNHPNVHIHTFQECWSFIWGCLFPVSIVKYKTLFKRLCGFRNNHSTNHALIILADFIKKYFDNNYHIWWWLSYLWNLHWPSKAIWYHKKQYSTSLTWILWYPWIANSWLNSFVKN